MNGYSERWLRHGFPWVYPAEVVGGGPAAVGEVVGLRAQDGSPLGTAIADQGWIAARRFRIDPGPVDRALLAERLSAARGLRAAVVPPETTAWRLVNAENDGLPGLRVDVWGDYASVALDSPSLLGLVPELAARVGEGLGLRGVVVGFRPDPRDTREGWPAPPGWAWGQAPMGPVVVYERGVAFRVELDARKDQGLFPDMRSVRAWLDPHWAGARVLNLFAHTGAFSVFAARGGAAPVFTVDLSATWLARAAENLRLNDLPEGELVEDDALRALDRLRRQGAEFDRVIVDPPAHSHSAHGTWSAEKDYPRLVAACLRVTAPGGWLVAACNLGAVSPRQFHGWLAEGAERAGRKLLVLLDAGAAPDFPAAMDFPEGRYLKVVVAAAVPWR